MAHQEDQKPVGSGFVPKTGTAEIIGGRDLSGLTAIVTGGYSGIGLETTRALAAAGARVIVPMRDPAKGESALADISGSVEAGVMDLLDAVSVRRFAAAFLDTGHGLDLLINNAGIMACPETRTDHGFESQFATNHLGHALLALELLPALQKAGASAGARVVCLSSVGHKRSAIRWTDPHFRSEPYEKWKAYGQSKTANALFALGLDLRLRDQGIRAFSVHPGGIFTPLQRHLPKDEMVALGWIDESGEMSEVARAVFKTPDEGASTTLWCALSRQLANMGGLYCEDCDVAAVATAASPRHIHVAPHAVDLEDADRLWALTDQCFSRL